MHFPSTSQSESAGFSVQEVYLELFVVEHLEMVLQMSLFPDVLSLRGRSQLHESDINFVLVIVLVAA